MIGGLGSHRDRQASSFRPEAIRILIRNSVAVAFLILVLGILGGCAESHEQRAQRLEPILSQAGFRVLPADTPSRAEKLGQMKPLKVVYFSHNGKPVYWFADPYVCHCLYRGNEKDYQKYEQLSALAASEQREEAVAAEDPTSQQAYFNYMASPAGQVFYGE